MLKVGLTGGIGAGKTTVSDCFQGLGVPVIDTDLIAHELVRPGSATLQEVVEEFGRGVLTDAGELDRRRLREMVFSDPSKRSALEAILHPKIRRATLERARGLNADYCVIVVPLLVETDFTSLVDRVLVVDAPDAARIGWIKSRSGLTDSAIDNIVAAQASREARLAVADYVIVNDGTLADLENETAGIHERILASLNAP